LPSHLCSTIKTQIIKDISKQADPIRSKRAGFIVVIPVKGEWSPGRLPIVADATPGGNYPFG
jgi:hypothetical protein